MKWRDLMCGEPQHVGRRIALAGWAHRRRDHGGLVFIDLRDHTGLCQLVVNPEHASAAAEAAHGVRNEFVLRAEGEVVARAPDLVNPNLPTGEVELRVETLDIVSTSPPLPFQLDEEGVDEMLRLRYRWLDLRRERVTEKPQALARGRRRHPTIDGRARLHRHLDARADAGHTRGCTRLPRPRSSATRCVLRPRPVTSAVQAAVHGRRVRPLLPDRYLLAGRRSSCRSPVRVPSARPRARVSHP